MKKFVRFALKTAFGPFVIWCGTAFLLFAAYALSPVLGSFGIILTKRKGDEPRFHPCRRFAFKCQIHRNFPAAG